MDSQVKKNWIEHQKKYPYPVNALGLRIDNGDDGALKIWREEGMDQFVLGRQESDS
ncbi:MAG: hypothetical protein AAF604_06960 [Acidobacteriota bacterium]